MTVGNDGVAGVAMKSVKYLVEEATRAGCIRAEHLEHVRVRFGEASASDSVDWLREHGCIVEDQSGLSLFLFTAEVERFRGGGYDGGGVSAMKWDRRCSASVARRRLGLCELPWMKSSFCGDWFVHSALDVMQELKGDGIVEWDYMRSVWKGDLRSAWGTWPDPQDAYRSVVRGLWQRVESLVLADSSGGRGEIFYRGVSPVDYAVEDAIMLMMVDAMFGIVSGSVFDIVRGAYGACLWPCGIVGQYPHVKIRVCQLPIGNGSGNGSVPGEDPHQAR